MRYSAGDRSMTRPGCLMRLDPGNYRRHYLILNSVIAVRRQSVAGAAPQGSAGDGHEFLHGGLTHPAHHGCRVAERALATAVITVVNHEDRHLDLVERNTRHATLPDGRGQYDTRNARRTDIRR